MKRYLRLAIIAACSAVAMTATRVIAADVNLAFIITNEQNPAEVGMAQGFKDQGEKLGAKVQIISAKGSVEKQTNAVDDMISQKVNGIAAIPLDSVVAESMVDKAQQAGIPFVAVATQVGDPNAPLKDVYPNLSALIGQDYIDSGARMAAASAQFLSKDKTNKIGIVEGQPGYALVKLLSQGFKAKLDELGYKYDIVFSQPTDWTPAKGQEVCQNGLVANPDLDLVFSDAEDMAIGCAKAIADANTKTKLVTIAGGSKLGTPLIKSGAIAISMCEAWQSTGALGAKALYEAATDPKTAKARLVAYQPVIITAENIDKDCSPPQW